MINKLRKMFDRRYYVFDRLYGVDVRIEFVDEEMSFNNLRLSDIKNKEIDNDFKFSNEFRKLVMSHKDLYFKAKFLENSDEFHATPELGKMIIYSVRRKLTNERLPYCLYSKILDKYSVDYCRPLCKSFFRKKINKVIKNCNRSLIVKLY